MNRAKRKKKRTLLIITMIIIALLIVFTIDSNRRLITTEYDVYSERLPESFEGFRVVQLSDLHGKEYGEENEKLLTAVREAEPDIIAITGDLFDEYTDDGYAEKICKQLMEIAPVYYVSGNHEWTKNPRNTFDKMKETGTVVMRNKYVTLEKNEDTIILAGVDDPNGPYDMITKEDFVAKIKANTDDFILMLSHRNTDFDIWTSLDVDLVLVGHAHGGIIRLPFIGGVLIHKEDLGTKHVEGTFEEGNTTMVVSRGTGSNGFVPRFNNNPEIVVVELHSK